MEYLFNNLTRLGVEYSPYYTYGHPESQFLGEGSQMMQREWS